MGGEPRVLVLGIGNLLWADEGWGVRVVEALQQRFAFAETVTVMDGGTQGLYLVQHICEADVLLVFDAIDYGLPPGTLKLVEGSDVPRFMGAKKMSLHQTGFQEVVMAAEMLGKAPTHMMLVGLQPAELEDFGGSLRDESKRQITAAIDAGLAYLARFGVVPAPHAAPPQLEAAAGALALTRYEEERPSVEDACRTADTRFLRSGGGIPCA